PPRNFPTSLSIFAISNVVPVERSCRERRNQRRSTTMTASVLTGTTEASAQMLTSRELDQARLFLTQAQNAVVGLAKGLAGAQWTFKPSADRWSIAENLNHIVTVQELVLGPIRAQLANAPAPPSGYDYERVDAIVIHEIPTRLQKFPAPEAA